MNRVPVERRSQINICLVEANSVRSTERMADTHCDTIVWLLVSVGEGCATLMDQHLQNLNCHRMPCAFTLKPPKEHSEPMSITVKSSNLRG